MTSGTLIVSEVFGPTLQGEGPSTGRPAVFIRLGACNLACRWCDTPYTWDASRYDLRAELTRTRVEDILTRATATNTPLAVITGGEPLLQQRKPGWHELLSGLADARITVEVETNGTLAPTDDTTAATARFNVSPKLAHAGDREPDRLRRPALTRFADLARDTPNAVAFKFVVRHTDDLHQVDALTSTYGIPARTVWIMPEGTTAAAQLDALPALADAAIARGYNVTTRLHVLMWGDERGR